MSATGGVRDTTVFCAGCRAELVVPLDWRGRFTPEALARLKAAGWRMVATYGLQCPTCEEERP